MSFAYPRRYLFALTLSAVFLAAVSCSDGETPFATAEPTATTSSQPQPTATSPGQQQPTPPAAPGGGGGGGDVAKGEAQFTSQGCSACHSTGSNTIVGPGLSGVGQRNGDAYLRQSITQPNAVIAEGFDPLMPTFPALSDADIEDIVAFLKTLQ